MAHTPRQQAQQQRIAQLRAMAPQAQSPAANGLPAPLRASIESLSGLDMSGVRVHRNSGKPAALQAHAYAQGQDIHLGPGQERHLPHEAWHVVQQAQGRVRPTVQRKGDVGINDDARLEREADVMGAKATQFPARRPAETGAGIQQPPGPGRRGHGPAVQAMLASASDRSSRSKPLDAIDIRLYFAGTGDKWHRTESSRPEDPQKGAQEPNSPPTDYSAEKKLKASTNHYSTKYYTRASEHHSERLIVDISGPSTMGLEENNTGNRSCAANEIIIKELEAFISKFKYRHKVKLNLKIMGHSRGAIAAAKYYQSELTKLPRKIEDTFEEIKIESTDVNVFLHDPVKGTGDSTVSGSPGEPITLARSPTSDIELSKFAAFYSLNGTPGGIPFDIGFQGTPCVTDAPDDDVVIISSNKDDFGHPGIMTAYVEDIQDKSPSSGYTDPQIDQLLKIAKMPFFDNWLRGNSDLDDGGSRSAQHDLTPKQADTSPVPQTPLRSHEQWASKKTARSHALSLPGGFYSARAVDGMEAGGPTRWRHVEITASDRQRMQQLALREDSATPQRQKLLDKLLEAYPTKP